MKTEDWIGLGAAIVIGYCGLSMFVYWVAHPELTQMQVFLSFFDAITWQW